MNKKIITLIGCILTVSALYSPVFGIEPYDPGRVIDQTRERPVPKPKKPAQIDVVEEAKKPEVKEPAGAKVKIQSFKINGASSIDEKELLGLLSGYAGKELTFPELQKLPGIIKNYYNSKGYFLAHAYLPPQEINKGIIQITVLEGKVDKVTVRGVGETRISDATIKGRLRDIQSGASVNGEELENRLLLMGDIPGVNVRAELQPGTKVGTTELILNVKERDLVTASIDTDNYGNYFSGEYRGGFTLNLNDMTGLGDQLSLRGVTAGEGLANGKLSYIMPVSDLGTKLGASFSYVHYQLGKQFKQLDQRGDSLVASVFATHPLIINRDISLYAQLGYDYKRFNDKVLNLSPLKETHSGNASLLFSSVDGFWGGGIFNTAFTLSAGSLDLDKTLTLEDLPPNGQDRRGAFGKINLNASRLQALIPGSTFFNLAFDGQSAFKNLDTTEKFSLGGPYGVRAYPSGEASGDDGFVATAELRQNLMFLKNAIPGDVQLTGFYDYGLVRKNFTAYWGGSDETETRAGAGFGINWGMAENFSIRSTAAWMVGDVPKQLSDGTYRRPRIYFQLVKWF